MTIVRSVVVITDDTVAAAMLSSCWSKTGKYVTVLETPRMYRPDAQNEIARLLNVIQRIRPRVILYFGNDPRVTDTISNSIPLPMLSFQKLAELARFGINVDEWKNLTPEEATQKLYRKHTQDDPHKNAILYNGIADVGYVIAANYAILHHSALIKLETPHKLLQETIDDLNKIDADPVEVREIDVRALTEKLADYIPNQLIDNNYEKILIVTEGIPFGIAVEDIDILYANNLMLGYFLAHNIYEHEWGQHERIGPIGLFIADRTVEMPTEYDNFSAAMVSAKGLPKRYETSNPKLAELEIMTLPYDILYIATHGKQLDGTEEEYTFTDSSGMSHNVVIERAHGVIGFVAYIKMIDGVLHSSVEWGTSHKEVWGEFATHYMYEGKPLPTPLRTKSGIKLPMRSLVLGHEPGMNSPFAVQRLASSQRPIVIANACGSWNEMSMRFTFAGAAAYIGTLWAVSSGTASQFATKFHQNLFNRPLDSAFFEARSSLASDLDKKNYVMTGSFENKYDASTAFSSNGYDEVRKRLERLLAVTRERIKAFDKLTPKDIRNNTEIDEMLYEKEIKALDNALKEIEDEDDTRLS